MIKQKMYHYGKCCLIGAILAIVINTAFIICDNLNSSQVNETVTSDAETEQEISDDKCSVTEVDFNVNIETETVTEDVEEITTVEETKEAIQYAVPEETGYFKSYTDYELLSKSSQQWNKIQCNANAYTDENGLRKIENYYLVAMGSYYTHTLGDIFAITTENGSFEVMICDFKDDRHTDDTNRFTIQNKCMVEFYIDIGMLNYTAKIMGDISYIDDKFQGDIIEITYLGNYFE